MVDHELVKQITGNPYLQYFIRLPDYQEEASFDASIILYEPVRHLLHASYVADISAVLKVLYDNDMLNTIGELTK